MLRLPIWTSWTNALDDNQHRVAQSISIVAHLPIILFVNAASAVIVALILSPGHALADRIAMVFFVWLMLLPLLVSWLRLRRRPPPATVSRRRIVTLIRYSAVPGIVWNIVMAWLLPHEDVSVVTFLIAGAGFLCVGCTAILSSLPLLCLAFGTPVLATAMLFSLVAPAPTSLGLVLMVFILAVGVLCLVVTG